MGLDMALSIIEEIMTEFAGVTGLIGAGKAPRRYLWTDAFALCNFLELCRRTNDEKYQDLALLLIDQVHNVLGRHREDDPRTGWISGLGEQEGQLHPTRGGLRIGKTLNERSPHESFDERLEWDRDGQYYHYLTKWMHALNCASRTTGDPTFNTWAKDLAKTAHDRFVTSSPSSGRKRMVWKMSIDLSYPLVTSMGHHDPLDGLITYCQLQATGVDDSEEPTSLSLNDEIADLAELCEGKSWATDDPLGIGGLLTDAYRLAQLMVHGSVHLPSLLGGLLDASLASLQSYASRNHLQLPADYRLAFRELGLSIGLRAAERLRRLMGQHEAVFFPKEAMLSGIQSVIRHAPLAEIIEAFWLEPANRKTQSWMEHGDINMVMLATSLAPDGYVTLWERFQEIE
jgi:hypothetical protein